ncbi:MAG: Holliday junction branch migration protein RuvA [Candidatus Puniceispirillum sp.]|uniref:Holliday junction branch migration protein RuvA n=1 Tax=uncultured Candidatus Puniceispirillum sp. TaxID=1985115 RepID=UPI002A6F0583|nr:Holliday junction branch migration protein RuvA [Candidatus Puniceispirillum sp.]MBT6566380.1 Holliday junction branch migration protein RuvA [Candidatus Puniceispirillum sp.]
MIAQLRGILSHTADSHAIIDVQGVGYLVNISGRTQGQLAAQDGAVTVLTEMIVREDSMTLYGFHDASERDAFRLLITVQGVGAKAAMAILSVLSPADLSSAIMAGDKAMVARADGVGPKIAQRVVNELAEKIGRFPSLGDGLAVSVSGNAGVTDSPVASAMGDALSALVNLGYGRSEAHAALLRVQQAGEADDLSGLIAAALREIGS